MSKLHDRIWEISRKHKLSHLGSCLTAVDIIDEIYRIKKPDEKFILSCGHAGMALYVVLEKYRKYDAELLYQLNGVHPNRDGFSIDCSTGSLGQGLPIALGMAMADRSKNVYCLISDGEATEGTIWEVANVMNKYNVTNLKVYCNWNGWGAYGETDLGIRSWIKKMGVIIIDTDVTDHGFTGQEAHYKQADRTMLDIPTSSNSKLNGGAI